MWKVQQKTMFFLHEALTRGDSRNLSLQGVRNEENNNIEHGLIIGYYSEVSVVVVGVEVFCHFFCKTNIFFAFCVCHFSLCGLQKENQDMHW